MPDVETTKAADPTAVVQVRHQVTELARGYRTAQVRGELTQPGSGRGTMYT